MKIEISPSKAKGSGNAPASKSMAHRLLICAAMAEGKSVVSGVSDCQDVSATLDCLSALGVEYSKNGEEITVRGKHLGEESLSPAMPLMCRESGSTLRFFLPIALLSKDRITLEGAPSLLKRPMTVYEELCKQNGLLFLQEESGITVQGPLQSGTYEIPGNVSSQFITGMLFALTQIKGESLLRITPPIESRSYILLTLAALREFGADVSWENDTTLRVRGGKSLTAHATRVEGDYSNAAFLEALNLFGGEVDVLGLRADSLQGDRVYRSLFAALEEKEPVISLADCPDLAPILFAVSAAKHGGIFTDTKRLKIKESDRTETMAEELRKFGAAVTVKENSVEIRTSGLNAPKEPINGHNDHRIVMSNAVLLTLTGGSIEGAEAVSKSYPAFFSHLKELGIAVKEL
ncbi:MAG: 3-phosphoshikimate 1-carboxyvinyltransferase [Clostridia bacterium]|nr:3-phosphoshikimate 1-carboxyvinyltransferase [Clostridia bacterium]